MTGLLHPTCVAGRAIDGGIPDLLESNNICLAAYADTNHLQNLRGTDEFIPPFWEVNLDGDHVVLGIIIYPVVQDNAYCMCDTEVKQITNL